MAAADAAPDVERLEQRFERLLVRRRDPNEEQDAATVARPAVGEEEQALVTALEVQIGAEHRLAVRHAAPGRVDPHDLWSQLAGLGRAYAGVSEAREVRLEFAAQMRAQPRISRAAPVLAA